MKKILKRIVLILIIIIVIYNLSYSVLKLLKIDMSFLGIRFLILETNAMMPAISQKDMLILKKPKQSDLLKDDIILYTENKNVRVGRILNINENMAQISYVVKADNRYLNETEQLLIENVKGKAIKIIPDGAIFLKILRSKFLTLFVVAILFIIYRIQQYKGNLRKQRINKRVK